MKIKEFFLKYWWIVLLFILVIIFFFPKECGSWSVLNEKNCKCFGILKADMSPGPSEGFGYSCYGICVSECVCKEGLDQNNMITIPCK